ncbi:MAG: GntR family transcriptional regulator [Verrucomicrobia bacterium]|jgi:GntR family transcriptional regulator|nr:GntR family transcriptional regulator [Verrucomicrobiota bacterium]
MDTTAYGGVAARLREEILAGQRAPGERLAGERELCEEYRVSRITLRHALRLLAEEGLLHKRQGSGNYVAPHPTRRIPVMIDYTGSMRDHAPQLQRRLLESGWRPADEGQAAALQIAPGERVFVAERLDSLEGHPVAWDRAAVPQALAGRLTPGDLEQVDFLERWTKRGRFRVDYCEQTIEAVPASLALARWLALRSGAPLLQSTEVYFAGPDQPVGVFLSCYHPRHMCIRSRFRWGRGVA